MTTSWPTMSSPMVRMSLLDEATVKLPRSLTIPVRAEYGLMPKDSAPRSYRKILVEQRHGHDAVELESLELAGADHASHNQPDRHSRHQVHEHRDPERGQHDQQVLALHSPQAVPRNASR